MGKARESLTCKVEGVKENALTTRSTHDSRQCLVNAMCWERRTKKELVPVCFHPLWLHFSNLTRLTEIECLNLTRNNPHIKIKSNCLDIYVHIEHKSSRPKTSYPKPARTPIYALMWLSFSSLTGIIDS